MSQYPPLHHPVFFLQDALNAAGASAEFAKDERTEHCWGLIVNGQPMVWLIDNRHPHEALHEDPAAAKLLERGVLVCCAQKPDAERVNGRWLPLAASPEYARDVSQYLIEYDAAFVGYIRDNGRAEILSLVASHYDTRIEQGVFGKMAVQLYKRARCGLNVPTGYGSSTSYDSANMRCFEILALGVPLVTAHEDYLTELGLIDGETCFTYSSPADCLEAVRKALESHKTGDLGRELGLEVHTYANRAKQVLEWLAT